MSQFWLDTRYSLDPAKPHNSRWIVRLGNDEFKPKFIRLQEMSFVNLAGAFPSWSNTVIFTENAVATEISVVIPQGDYSGTEIASYLTTAMNAASATITVVVTFDSNTLKLEFDAGADELGFVSGSNTCYDQLGITTLDGAVASIVTSDEIVRLDGPEYLDVVSDVHDTLTNYSDNGLHNLLTRIRLKEAYGGVIFHEPPLHTDLYLSKDISTASLAIRLVLPDGHEMELPASCPVNYHFVAFH